MATIKYRKPTRSDAVKIYRWCMNEYGRSKINGSYPELIFRKPDYLTEDCYGEYDSISNTLFISKTENIHLIDLIDTIIHEWIHYLQPIRSHLRTMRSEKRLHEAFNNKDPLEIEAQKIAKRDKKKCFLQIYKI